MKSKILYILIGPQGSGKTTYIERSLQGVVRISQDEQGKKGHFDAFEQALKDGNDIVVDRINHIREQRRRYTEWPRKNGYRIHFVWFDVDRQLCTERLAHRKNHPTINQTRDNHERILASYFRDFEKPEHFEYDEITVVTKRKNASVLDLRQRIKDQKFIVVGDIHAGVDGRFPMDRQPLENCLYARYFGGEGFLDESGEIWHTTLDGSYNVISGHMIHSFVFPYAINYVFLLDGGAFRGGELRGLIVENGQHRIESVKSKCYTVDEVEVNVVAARDELVDQGLLRCDDRGDLRIYNYTDECTHSAAWNDITMNSRGIIFNVKTGEVVAQPMPKFFNVGEREDTAEDKLPWDSDYLVFEKMDGWLGTLYRYNGQHRVATRGSFDGMGVAPWATKFLNDNYDLSDLPDEVTLVFEIICPNTHIIVNYDEREDLILLTAYNRRTGEEYKWDQVTAWAKKFGFPLPRVFGSDVNECRRVLTEHAGTELEGFVIRFEDGLRVKIKSEDYKRRAAIVSNLTPLAIWKAMRDGLIKNRLSDYRNTIDADYIELFDELVNALEIQYEALDSEILGEFETLRYNLVHAGVKAEDATYRKEFALRSQKFQHRSAMFALLDKKSVRDYIIKRIRPTFNEFNDPKVKKEFAEL